MVDRTLTVAAGAPWAGCLDWRGPEVGLANTMTAGSGPLRVVMTGAEDLPDPGVPGRIRARTVLLDIAGCTVAFKTSSRHLAAVARAAFPPSERAAERNLTAVPGDRPELRLGGNTGILLGTGRAADLLASLTAMPGRTHEARTETSSLASVPTGLVAENPELASLFLSGRLENVGLPRRSTLVSHRDEISRIATLLVEHPDNAIRNQYRDVESSHLDDLIGALLASPRGRALVAILGESS